MKKFLTVLLVIAVMFTFSFGSAFAYTDAQLQNVVDSHEAAVKAIQDKYDANLAAINRDYANKVVAPQGGAAKDAWKAACDVALEEAKAELDKELAQAWNALATAEAGVENPKGWDIGNATAEEGYVNVTIALGMLTKDKLGDIDAGKPAFDAALAKVQELIKNYNLEQFVKDDNYNNTGKSSYETAVAAQTDALALLASYKYPLQKDTDVYAVYNITGVGTLGEKESGTFYDKIKNLKTTATLKTDEAKIAYAKSIVVKDIKAMIEEQREAELKVQNDIIFAQSIASKPDQSKIDKANAEIEKINAKYDAYAKVWTYRLENGTYKVNEDKGVSYIDLMYGTDKIAYLGCFENNAFVKRSTSDAYDWANLTKCLPLADGEKIVGYVADLEKEAAQLKATIYVDGDVAIDVDAALADAIEETYMTGAKAALSTVLTNSAVHARAHQLLGTTCAGTTKTDKVTVNGKKYDNLSQWTTAGYSYGNTAAVKAIKSEAKAAIKKASTIAEAEAAFVAAYEKYDAVLTIAEQKALFTYSGSLYKKDTAAQAELNAYIQYKVALLSDAPSTDVATKITNYFGIAAVATMTDAAFKDSYLGEVVDEASLQDAIAEVKAAVDGIKSATTLKAEDKALRDKIVASARPATLANKDAIIALYDEYLDFADYCKMVGYTNSQSNAVVGLLTDDVKRLAGLEKDALDELVKAIEKDGKVTLDDRANVDALVAGMDAYNDLYPEYALKIAKYTTQKDYEHLIFLLDVDAANKLIAALPAYGATAAQIKEARAAVDALGFNGICYLNDTMMTKLNRLEDSLAYDVEALKITAGSTAKKGSITVKWTVKGNAAAADGYQIWKSTKKNSGYKKMFTTTKTSYKNTKGLKKGTRYYYKVRAYKTVGGKNVYSDWSNKAYRIAK